MIPMVTRRDRCAPDQVTPETWIELRGGGRVRTRIPAVIATIGSDGVEERAPVWR